MTSAQFANLARELGLMLPALADLEKRIAQEG